MSSNWKKKAKIKVEETEDDIYGINGEMNRVDPPSSTRMRLDEVQGLSDRTEDASRFEASRLSGYGELGRNVHVGYVPTQSNAIKDEGYSGSADLANDSSVELYPYQGKEMALPSRESHENQELYSIPEYEGSYCGFNVQQDAEEASKTEQAALPSHAESQETILRQKYECGICKGLRGPDRQLYDYKGHYARECTRNVSTKGTINGCPWCNTRTHNPSSPQCTSTRSLKNVWRWLIAGRDGKPMFTCSWDMYRMLKVYFSDPANTARPQTARFAQERRLRNEDQPIMEKVHDPFWNNFEATSMHSTVTWDQISGWSGDKDRELPELDPTVGRNVHQLAGGGRLQKAKVEEKEEQAQSQAPVEAPAQGQAPALGQAPAQNPARGNFQAPRGGSQTLRGGSQAPRGGHHAGGTQPFKQEGSQSGTNKRGRSDNDQEFQGSDKRQQSGYGSFRREISKERQIREMEEKMQQSQAAMKAEQRKQYLAALDSQREMAKAQMEFEEAKEVADLLRNEMLREPQSFNQGFGSQGSYNHGQTSSYASSSSHSGQSYQEPNRDPSTFRNRDAVIEDDVAEPPPRPDTPANEGGHQQENRGGYRGRRPWWGRGGGRGRGGQ